MLMHVPNFPIIIYNTYEPTDVIYFSLGVNGLNGLYFVKYGSYPVFTNPEFEVLSLFH